MHPGEILLEEFLKPLEISSYRLAKETGLSQTRISEIIHKKRSVTAETALRFSKFFGNSAEFWLGLQNDYDLEENRISLHKELQSIRSMVEANASMGSRAAAAVRFRKALGKVSNRRPAKFDRV